jgi:TRAP-type C4-dicarboxylate transport system permease small subunit
MSEKLSSLFDLFLNLTSFLVGGVILSLMLAVCVNVLLRYIFNRPIAGVEEITEYFLLFITFIGAAWLLREEGHVKVDILLGRLSSRRQALMSAVSSLIGILISSTLVWYGGRVTWDNLQQEAYFSSILEFPKAPVFAIIPLGSSLLLIQFIRRTLQNLQNWRSEK